MIYPSDECVGSFISSSTLVSKKAKENVLQTWMKRKPNCSINKTACVKLCSTKSLTVAQKHIPPWNTLFWCHSLRWLCTPVLEKWVNQKFHGFQVLKDFMTIDLFWIFRQVTHYENFQVIQYWTRSNEFKYHNKYHNPSCTKIDH